MSYEAGTRLGPYEIHSPLDRGGMGEVYRARDVRLDRYVALKVLPSALTRDEHRRARFEREAKAVARLQHPHICAVYDVGVGDVPYLVLELLDGRTLAQHLSEGRPSLQAVMAWIDQIGKALEYAHQQGVIHRDLKPANVMITPTGAKLLDFGLARFEHESADGDVTMVSHPATSGGIVLGTPGYMSPEQAAGSAVGTRSDVFAFGVLAYELLTGVPAFRRTTPAESLAALFGGGLRLPSEVRSDLPSALDPVIERCCAQKADARYESVREAAAALAEGLAGATVEVAVRPAPEPVLAPAIPEPVTSLVGREREVEEIRHLLQNPAVRLITLTGPGGGGKTRLAVDVARRSGTIFPGGVFFVDLGSINDPARFDLAVAAELQVRLRPGESLTGAVATAFRENRRPRTLVVLDSFEQLVDTAPRLTQLLQAVPDLTCLVTSRIVLHLTGEREFPVLPLPVPDTSRRPEPGQLAKVPSVALFLERAQSANPAFALDTDNVMAVAQICVRLDGLPLALELAAARVRALTPQALLSRLERRLPVLTTGARDLPVRQQTLRNTIEWSYDLLTEAEQRLLRRLAVFTGGCTLEAVESVCDAGQDLGVDALNGVSSLADKSLVQLRPDPDGDTRVTMLETIREYGVERLAESEDVVSLHRAHAAYYLLLAEDGNAALSGEHHDLWLRRFTSDHDNFRGALDWMLAHAQLDWGLRLGIALFPFWQWKEHGLEARGRLRRLAAMRGEAATAEWAKLLMSLGILHSELAEYKDSADAFLESLAISRRLGDRSAEVVTLNNLGVSQRLHGSYDSAVRYLEEALAILRGDSDAAAVARTLTNLAATCVERGDVDRSRLLYAEAFQIFERLGDTSGMAVTLHGAGDTCRAAGSFEDAESAYRRALDAYGALDDRWGGASVLVDLGALAVVRDQASDGRRHFREALEAFASLGYSRGLARVIEELSIAAARQGLGEQGLRLAGAAAGLRRRLGVSATAREQQRIASVVEPLRRAHGDRAWLEGRDLDQGGVIAAARAATDGA